MFLFAYASRVYILLILPILVVSQSSSSAPVPNPTRIPCPSDVALVRSAGAPTNQSLSQSEQAYISARTSTVLPGAWQAYLKNVNSTSSSPLPSYVSSLTANSSNSTLPNVGIAISGGGYRAAFFGAAVLNSLDGRNTTSAQKTGTGGLLQAVSYISALSGGSWLVTALAQANFPTIEELIFPSSSQNPQNQSDEFGGFLAQFDFVAPGPSPNDTLSYLQALVAESRGKHDSTGLPVTITDPWSRIVARHFVNGTTAGDIVNEGTHGADLLFSGIADLPTFQAHTQPFPILIADSLAPQPNISSIIPGNSVPLTTEIWEFNVFESGSFDPSLGSFIPTALLGSTNSSSCMKGFDQRGFIAGVSSNLFNLFNVSESALADSIIGPLLGLIKDAFPEQNTSNGGGVRLDSALIPNPFRDVNPSTYTSTNETFVTLVDGGSNGNVVPFQPLLVRARGIDTIIAVDASADTDENYANGTNLINAAKRSAIFGAQYPFPAVPATADNFLQQGLTTRPTFFGCNDSSESATPLIIYIALGGPPAGDSVAVTNASSLKTSWTPEEIQAFLDQAFLVSTQGISNGTTPDPEWGACLACAGVDRARARAGVQREGICADCFTRYCWSGEGEGGNGTATDGGAGDGKSTGKNGAAGLRVGGNVVGVVVAVLVVFIMWGL